MITLLDIALGVTLVLLVPGFFDKDYFRTEEIKHKAYYILLYIVIFWSIVSLVVLSISYYSKKNNI